MRGFLASKTDDTTRQMLKLVSSCRNTTVGPNKYQLFCQTLSNLDGSCTLLPSYLTLGGKLDCVDVISQSYLQDLYDTTGMFCAVNCYYPLGTTSPGFDLPSYTYSYSYSYPYSYNDPFYATSTTTLRAQSSGRVLSSQGSASSTISPYQTASGSNVMDPSLIVTIMSVFTVMILFARRAI